MNHLKKSVLAGAAIGILGIAGAPSVSAAADAAGMQPEPMPLPMPKHASAPSDGSGSGSQAGAQKQEQGQTAQQDALGQQQGQAEENPGQAEPSYATGTGSSESGTPALGPQQGQAEGNPGEAEPPYATGAGSSESGTQAPGPQQGQADESPGEAEPPYGTGSSGSSAPGQAWQGQQGGYVGPSAEAQQDGSGAASGSTSSGPEASAGQPGGSPGVAAAEHRGPRVAQLAREVMASVDEAEQALSRGDENRARSLLSASADALRALYVGAPGTALLDRIDQLSARLSQDQASQGTASGAELEGGGFDEQAQHAPGEESQGGQGGSASASGGAASQGIATGHQEQDEQALTGGGQQGTGSAQAQGEGAQAGQQGAESGTGSAEAQGEGAQAGQQGAESGTGSAQAQGEGAQGGQTYAPLFASIRREAVYADPEVVAGTRRAEHALDQGNTQRARDELSLAREQVVTNVALLPIEDAYARVVAAQAELDQGDPDTARRLLSGIPVAMEQVTARAPMVPVRFALNAAADAAQHGNWGQARQLVGQARIDLGQLEDQASPQTSPDVQQLTSELEDVEDRIDAGNRPPASELQNLAAQAGNVSLG